MLLRQRVVHSRPWTQVQSCLQLCLSTCVICREVPQNPPYRLQGNLQAQESTAATSGGTAPANGLPGWLTGTSAGDM